MQDTNLLKAGNIIHISDFLGETLTNLRAKPTGSLASQQMPSEPKTFLKTFLKAFLTSFLAVFFHPRPSAGFTAVRQFAVPLQQVLLRHVTQPRVQSNLLPQHPIHPTQDGFLQRLGFRHRQPLLLAQHLDACRPKRLQTQIKGHLRQGSARLLN